MIAASLDAAERADDARPTMSVDALTGTLNFVKVRGMKLTVSGHEKPLELLPAPQAGMFLADRGLIRPLMERPLPPQPISVAVTRGFDDARRGVGEIYRTLRALVTFRVSRKLLGGPVTIAQAAHASASEGLGKLMSFLGMLSINLAVLNFLPIAPLDGGQMVLLMGEKVRGKPENFSRPDYSFRLQGHGDQVPGLGDQRQHADRHHPQRGERVEDMTKSPAPANRLRASSNATFHLFEAVQRRRHLLPHPAAMSRRSDQTQRH